HPVRNEEHTTQPTIRTVSDELTVSPCIQQIAGFGVEGGTFVATVAGAVGAARFKKYMDRAILSMFFETPKYEREIVPLLRPFIAADGKVAKATAFVPIARKFWEFGIIRVCFDIIKSRSSYLDWLVDGAIALAQIVVWVA